MAKLSQKKAEGQQIEQKKQQLKQLSEEINAIVNELQEAGAWSLSDDELNDIAGGCPRPPKAYFSNGSPST